MHAAGMHIYFTSSEPSAYNFTTNENLMLFAVVSTSNVHARLHTHVDCRLRWAGVAWLIWLLLIAAHCVKSNQGKSDGRDVDI
jgi:hypothetical protein